MGEAALGEFLKVILKQIADATIQELISAYGVKRDIKKLCSNFTAIKAVLDDAEEQQWTNKKMKDWLEKIKDVAYDVEDILDDFAVEEHRRRDEIDSFFKNKVRNFFSLSNPVIFRIKMANRVKEVVERLEAMAKEKSDFNLTENASDDTRVKTRMNYPTQNQTHSFVHESDVIGRDSDKERLVQLLMHESGEQDKENVSVIPIVGMGGLGKTTLAQFVYNDKRVMEHFDTRMWAHVSQNFDVAEIIRAIIASANEDSCNVENMDALQSRLRRILQENKYLLVLDDVWNENPENWGQLRTFVKCGKKGSKIIVTTRSEIAASIMTTTPIYFLKELGKKDCWSLFVQCAFPTRDEHVYPNLVEIGKDIVGKCGGVPLAIKVLGGLLMHYKTSENKWLSLRDDPIWKLNDDKIMSSLRLSYNHLPSHLKQCFAYFSLFPKDFRVSQNHVIRVWIGEGFIQSTEGEHEKLEDIGNEYFHELHQRSLFQFYGNRASNIYENWWKRNKKIFIYMEAFFMMHDLVHDLATAVAGSDYSLQLIGRTPSINEKVRRLSCTIDSPRALLNPNCFQHKHNLRSLTIESTHSRALHAKVLHEIFCLQHLRFLSLQDASITTLPESISNLKQLRYLDLSHNDFEMLPKSITSLINLQILFLVACRHLRELPSDMCKMISLRHLIINCHWDISATPPNIGHLSCLQTLSFFVVDKNGGCGIHQLQNLNLRGALAIRNLQNVLNPAEAEQAGLKHKKNLENIWLHWKQEVNSNMEIYANSEHVIESLQPHSEVKALRISHYMGKTFPSWLMDLKMTKLVDLALYNCERCNEIPPFGHLSSLKILQIEGMPDLEGWSNTQMIPILSNVERLVVRRCPKLTYLPHLPCLRHLELMECNELILSCKIESTSLHELTISGFAELTSFPQGLFLNSVAVSYLEIGYCPRLKSLSEDFYLQTSIKYMKFVSCHKVESLMKGWHTLNSLEYLEVVECHSFKSLSSDDFCRLSSLKKLRIVNCQGLISLDDELECLTRLEELHISNCPSMVGLPKCMRKLKAMEYLCLKELPKLESLHGVGSLTSLKRLVINECHNILALPESLRNVSSLYQLEIVGCPQLQSRCSRDRGEDWRKIDHVPLIKILPG